MRLKYVEANTDVDEQSVQNPNYLLQVGERNTSMNDKYEKALISTVSVI